MSALVALTVEGMFSKPIDDILRRIIAYVIVRIAEMRKSAATTGPMKAPGN